MTVTVICRSTSSADGICWQRSLRCASVDVAAGAVEEVTRIVGQVIASQIRASFAKMA
jgi:hypothetical protein